MSTWTVPDRRPATTTSCRSDSAATTALPIVPAPPMTMMRTRPSFSMWRCKSPRTWGVARRSSGPRSWCGSGVELDAVAGRRFGVACGDLGEVVRRRLVGVRGALERLFEELLHGCRREREEQAGACRAGVMEPVHVAARDVDVVAPGRGDDSVAEPELDLALEHVERLGLVAVDVRR